MTIKFRLAFIGNHTPRWSTENDLGWTFEQLGWEVVRLQENSTSTGDILRQSLDCDFMLWVHTHSWEIPGPMTMQETLIKLKERSIPTVGCHMDRYFGIPEREEMLQSHPFFKCAQLWTADGGNQDKFASLGIDHHWFPPAICSRNAWLGEWKEEFDTDVVFVGSRGYHKEWPWRETLVAWLDQPHDRFRVTRWGGDRPYQRENLNDIFASAKIVVGDSMFAGAPFYWSDRIPESQGRGGFLLHPVSEGMDVTGMGNIKPCDLQDLENVILYYLDNPGRRERMRRDGYEYTKRRHLWQHRLLNLLNCLGCN